jgi:hypothetical protein
MTLSFPFVRSLLAGATLVVAATTAFASEAAAADPTVTCSSGTERVTYRHKYLSANADWNQTVNTAGNIYAVSTDVISLPSGNGGSKDSSWSAEFDNNGSNLLWVFRHDNHAPFGTWYQYQVAWCYN